MHKDAIDNLLKSIPFLNNYGTFKYKEHSLLELELGLKVLKEKGVYFIYHKNIILYIGLAYGQTIHWRLMAHLGKGTNFMYGNKSAGKTKQWTTTYEKFIKPTGLDFRCVQAIGITWDNPTKSQVAAVEGILVDQFQPLINNDTFDEARLEEAKQYV